MACDAGYFPATLLFLPAGDMNIKLSSIEKDGTSFSQTVTYRNSGRTRREIFCGRTSKELGAAIHDRVRELTEEFKTGLKRLSARLVLPLSFFAGG